jgi:hypothetical protein
MNAMKEKAASIRLNSFFVHCPENQKNTPSSLSLSRTAVARASSCREKAAYTNGF